MSSEENTKISIKFWNIGQWHWKSENMSSPNSDFIKHFAYFVIIMDIISPALLAYKDREIITNLSKSEFGYTEPSVNSGIWQ